MCTSLFHQFMIYLNRIFLEKEYIHDRKAYSSDSQIDQLLTYINRNLSADLSVEALLENIISVNITSCEDLKRRPDTPCTATLSASGFSWPANSLQTARL